MSCRCIAAQSTNCHGGHHHPWRVASASDLVGDDGCAGIAARNCQRARSTQAWAAAGSQPLNVYRTSSGTDIARFASSAATTGSASASLQGDFTLALSQLPQPLWRTRQALSLGRRCPSQAPGKRLCRRASQVVEKARGGSVAGREADVRRVTGLGRSAEVRRLVLTAPLHARKSTYTTQRPACNRFFM
jgi:hypothetical protein